jgi:hypothetical protein
LELGVDEISRFSRRFLAGNADQATVNKLKDSIEEDLQVALELLTQMQEALEETAPFGFTPEQWIEVDSKVLKFFEPFKGGSKSSGPGFFSKLFSGSKKSDLAQSVATRFKPRKESKVAPKETLAESESEVLAQVIENTQGVKSGSRDKFKVRAVKFGKIIFAIVAVLTVIAAVFAAGFYGFEKIKSKIVKVEIEPVKIQETVPEKEVEPVVESGSGAGSGQLPQRAIPAFSDPYLPAEIGNIREIESHFRPYFTPEQQIDPLTGQQLPLPSH